MVEIELKAAAKLVIDQERVEAFLAILGWTMDEDDLMDGSYPIRDNTGEVVGWINEAEES